MLIHFIYKYVFYPFNDTARAALDICFKFTISL